jgi:hypothetical protein
MHIDGDISASHFFGPALALIGGFASGAGQPYNSADGTTNFVYPATDTQNLTLDGNRTDSYTPDGTIERPYNTLTQLIAGMANVTGPFVINCTPTTSAYTYTGAVTFPNYQTGIVGQGCAWNITGNVTIPGVYQISNLYTTITGTLVYTDSSGSEKIRTGGSLTVNGGVTTSGYDHFFDMSILSNTVINVGAGSTPVFTNVVGTPLYKSMATSDYHTVLTIIDSQSLATGAYTNVDMSNGGLAIIRGFIATNNNTVPNINLAGSSGSSTTVASELAGVSAAWMAGGASYTYLDNGSVYGVLTGTHLLTPNGLGMSAPAANTMTVKSGTTGAATFDSGTTGAVNVGTGANAKTVTIGNTTGASSLVLNAGTLGVSGSVVSTDGTMAANSDTVIPSQKAVVTYVGNKINGYAWRAPAQHLDSTTTAPGTAIVGQTTYTSDGFALVNGDRVLFTNASAGTYLNKVYTVAGVGTSITLTLATDGQSGTGAPSNGDAIFITQGTANGGRIFVYNSASSTWVQASSTSGSLLATNNLNDVSNTATARTNISAAKSGANSDITSLTGLTTATASTSVTTPLITAPASTALTLNTADVQGNIDYSGTSYMQWSTTSFHPTTSNAYSLGAVNALWSNLYTTNTSSENINVAKIVTDTSDAYALTVPGILAYGSGMTVWFQAGTSNTTAAPSINVNALGAYSLYKCGNATALAIGDIPTVGTAIVTFNTTSGNANLVNPVTQCGGGSTSGVTSQYLRAYQSSNEANPSAGGYITFNTLQISSGSDISINTTTGVVTLAAGHAYSISATPGYVNFGSTGASSSFYDLYNITSAAAIPSSGCYYLNSANSSNVAPGDSPCSAIIQTMVTTTIAFQFVGAVNPGTLIPTNGSAPWISITEIPATTALPAGSATDSTLAGLTTAADTGTAQAHVATLSPAITAYANGLEVKFTGATTNTATAPTLAVNGLTAITITKCGGQALAVGDIPTTLADFFYTGSTFELQNPVTNCTSMVWQSYSPSVVATGTTPSRSATYTQRALYAVLGKTLYLSYTYYSASTAGAASGSGAYLISLPAGYTVNTTVAPLPTVVSGAQYAGIDGTTVGSAQLSAGTFDAISASVEPLTSTQVGIFIGGYSQTTSSYITHNTSLWSDTIFGFTIGNNTRITFTAAIPVN